MPRINRCTAEPRRSRNHDRRTSAPDPTDLGPERKPPEDFSQFLPIQGKADLMFPSSELCRAQEAYQLDRARKEPLQNVRVIAEKAAAAWRTEAIAADHREARVARTKAISLAMTSDRDAQEWETLVQSENPDRGMPER